MKFDFNALNFEILDANTNAYPDIFINQNGVTFTKKVLDDLNYPAFVLCQLDVKNKVLRSVCARATSRGGISSPSPRESRKPPSVSPTRIWLTPFVQLWRAYGKAINAIVCVDFGSQTQKRCVLTFPRGCRKIIGTPPAKPKTRNDGERLVHRMAFLAIIG